MRAFGYPVLLAFLGACAPAPQPSAPAQQTSSEAPADDPRDPQQRARAVEAQTLQQFERQDEALERQGG